MSPQKWLQLRVTLLASQPLLMITTVTNLKSVNDNQTVNCQKQMNQFLSPCFIREQHIAALLYTILQDSINSLFSSITHSSKQLKENNLPDSAFWKANTFSSCSKGLIFVL